MIVFFNPEIECNINHNYTYLYDAIRRPAIEKAASVVLAAGFFQT